MEGAAAFGMSISFIVGGSMIWIALERFGAAWGGGGPDAAGGDAAAGAPAWGAPPEPLPGMGMVWPVGPGAGRIAPPCCWIGRIDPCGGGAPGGCEYMGPAVGPPYGGIGLACPGTTPGCAYMAAAALGPPIWTNPPVIPGAATPAGKRAPGGGPAII